MIAEMAVRGEGGTLVERFFQCLGDYGIEHLQQSYPEKLDVAL